MHIDMYMMLNHSILSFLHVEASIILNAKVVLSNTFNSLHAKYLKQEGHDGPESLTWQPLVLVVVWIRHIDKPQACICAMGHII